MTRNELLKLPEGIYLLTDQLCNYKYILNIRSESEQIYEYGRMLGEIYDYFYYTGSTFVPHTTIFYSEEKIEVDWSYSTLKVMKLSGLTKIGGIGDSHDFYRSLKELRMIGKFNRDTLVEDIEKFRLNWWINLDLQYKKRKRKEKVTIKNK